MSIEAMKQALEALEEIHPGNMTPMAEEAWNKVITALRKAIEQAEKLKPSLWFAIGKDGRVKYTTDSERALKWKQAGSYRLVRDYYTLPVHASDISQERVDETAKDRHDLTCVCGAVWVGEEMVCSPRKREWVGLTDEEVGGLTVFDGLTHIEVPILADFVRAIESKLKEKNCSAANNS
jgi:hypothetical protein